MRISDWSSDVCSSDLFLPFAEQAGWQRLAGRDAMAEGREVAGAEIAVFQDLAIQRRHRGEQGCPVLLQQRRPDLHIARTVIAARGGTDHPGIDDADAPGRSAAQRAGKGVGRTCNSGWTPDN